MTRKRQIKLGAMLYGVGTGYDDWRHPDAVLDACVNIGFYRRQAALAESGKFDFVFFTDHVHITPASTWHYLNRFEALTVLSAIAGATSRIGLVASVSLAYSEPFTTARQLASLDGISGGRAGWNAVTSWTKGSEGNFRKPPGLTEESRFRYAKEYLEVIKGLWDSWEDGAFVRDKQSGVYFDPGKLHELNHRGEFFAVKGPLNIARSRQGHPVLFQVGTGEDIREFAAEHADVLFVGHDDLEEARAFYREMKKRAASYGRDPGELIILQGIGPIVGINSEEAERLYSEKLALLSLDNALASLSRAFNGFDFSRYPLDGPFPALDVQSSALAGIQQSSRTLVRTAKERGWTLREAAVHALRPDPQFVGTAGEIADRLQEWMDGEAVDGFMVSPPLPDSLERFVSDVVPILQQREIYREDYRENTLRGHLGLPVPANRYSQNETSGQAVR